MKTICLFFLLLCLINPSGALTNVPDANSTDTIEYSNTSYVDSSYFLDTSDAMTKFNINFRSWIYPYSQAYIFSDVSGNILTIQFSYTRNVGLLTTDYYRNTTALYNGNPVLLTEESINLSEPNVAYEISQKHTEINSIFEGKQSFINIVSFNPDKVVIDGNFFSQLWIFNDVINNVNFKLDNPMYAYTVGLPYTDNSKYEFVDIKINYRDASISQTEVYLETSYSELSFPFQFLFLGFKTVLKVLNILSLGSLVSDLAYYQFQIWFIEPLKIIDKFIGAIIWIIHFVLTQGILWFIGLSEAIIFIYAYSTSRDILETFKNFAKYSVSFFDIVIIKPAMFIYERVLLKIIELIRG